jgi:ATP-binding cassette subfamily B protein
VGPSGAGKSSLLGLLLGWHQASGGAVLIDGLPLSVERLLELRRETAWVDPAIQIWNRSLLDNLRYSPTPGRHQDLGQILERADMAKLLAHWPEGLQTPLGEGGAGLSGGEGQRVRLGRALWQRGVRLALLDEPFRGLDRAQRHRHLSQARRFWHQATLVCVTHDVAVTRSFDRVVVVEDGGIVEDGSPMARSQMPGSRYRSLLDMEHALQRDLWGASVWRRIQLEGGRVRESDMSGACDA